LDLKERTREGREPLCAFCKAKLARPEKMVINNTESVLGGTCASCGALYLVDPTSKNVGEVMMQALGLAADKQSKDISDMIPGQDYEDAILSYDLKLHRSSGEPQGFMDGNARLYMIKVLTR
jgi:hypothetical protein